LGAPGLTNWAGGMFGLSEGEPTNHGHGLLSPQVYDFDKDAPYSYFGMAYTGEIPCLIFFSD